MLSFNLPNFGYGELTGSYINGPVINQLLTLDQKLGTLKVLARSSMGANISTK